MVDWKSFKVIAAGVAVAVLSSCNDGKEKTHQDDKQKDKTERVRNAQELISELSSSGISVLKAGKEGKPDSLLYSVEKEGNVYSNPKYEATDDVSKALGIELLGYEIAEIKINKKDAERVFGSVLGDMNTGDAFEANGYRVNVLDDNAQNSIKMRKIFNYRDLKQENRYEPDGNDVEEFSYKADKKAEKSSGKWNVMYKNEEYSVRREKDVYESGSIETSFEVKGGTMAYGVYFEFRGKGYSLDFGDLSKANIVRDEKLPKKPEAPKRKIDEALVRTLADIKKNKR